MNDYTLGLLTLPALAVILVAAWVVIKHLLALSGKAAANVALRLPRKATRHQRAAFAAIIFGAKRARFATFGEVGIGVIVGLDHDEQRLAMARLDPPLSLDDLRLPAAARAEIHPDAEVAAGTTEEDHQ